MYQNKPKAQIIFGRNPILEALENGKQFERLVLKSGLKGEFADRVSKLCIDRNIPLKRVPQIRLDKLSKNKNHQGVLGYISLVEYQSIRDLIPFLYEQGETPNLLMLDGVTDVRNLGAIARSAEVLGCNGIILPFTNSAEINEDAIKTSAGALLNIPVCREYSFPKTIDFLKESGIRIFASSIDAETQLHELDLNAPVTFIIGSEHTGVQKSLIHHSHHSFKIPQAGNTDSLNVSVATGIILYECLKQKMK